VSLFNYAVNFTIVLAAFWLVKRKINNALMKKLAIIVLPITLVGMAIWTVFLAFEGGYITPSSLGLFWSTLIFVGVVEVYMLAFFLRWSKLSTLGQGILIGVAMIIVGFFVGLPVTFTMLR
jgi:hypothetical protein